MLINIFTLRSVMLLLKIILPALNNTINIKVLEYMFSKSIIKNMIKQMINVIVNVFQNT